MARKKKSKARRTKTAAKKSPAKSLRCARLGNALAIEYRHAKGKAYRHTFTTKPVAAISNCGRYLVIGPVALKQFLV